MHHGPQIGHVTFAILSCLMEGEKSTPELRDELRFKSAKNCLVQILRQLVRCKLIQKRRAIVERPSGRRSCKIFRITPAGRERWREYLDFALHWAQLAQATARK